MKEKIAKIKEVREIMTNLKVSDLKDKELAIALTQLKMVIDETFELIKFKRVGDFPCVYKEK